MPGPRAQLLLRSLSGFYRALVSASAYKVLPNGAILAGMPPAASLTCCGCLDCCRCCCKPLFLLCLLRQPLLAAILLPPLLLLPHPGLLLPHPKPLLPQARREAATAAASATAAVARPRCHVPAASRSSAVPLLGSQPRCRNPGVSAYMPQPAPTEAGSAVMAVHPYCPYLLLLRSATAAPESCTARMSCTASVPGLVVNSCWVPRHCCTRAL